MDSQRSYQARVGAGGYANCSHTSRRYHKTGGQVQIGSPLHIPPIANPRFTGILQPSLGPETSCCVIYDLFSAGDVSLADLANAVLLTCLAVGAD